MSSMFKKSSNLVKYLTLMRTLMENIEEDIEKIKRIIEEVKPQYVSFGGDIEFVDVKDHDVRIRPTGYCWR